MGLRRPLILTFPRRGRMNHSKAEAFGYSPFFALFKAFLPFIDAFGLKIDVFDAFNRLVVQYNRLVV